MNFAPINPSDKHFGLGVYGIKRSLPTVLGFEGCGEIVEL
jgi:NADPH:quinone reductase-like Zn-dependent oxidoreductase